jgi:hypothetical protein
MLSEIASLGMEIYDRYVLKMALIYWKRTHACVLVSDQRSEPESPWFMLDVNELDSPLKSFPFSPGEVGLMHVKHSMEYISSSTWLLAEAHRCLAPGGLLVVTDIEGGFSLDVTPRATSSTYPSPIAAEELYSFVFRRIRVRTFYPSEWHRKEGLRYQEFHLAAVKGGDGLHGAPSEMISRVGRQVA